MKFVKNYLIPRLITYFLVIFVGITMVFFIPRFLPTDPVQQFIARFTTQGVYMDPKSVENMISTLKQLYGLEGSLWEQYRDFLVRFSKLDFGPSYYQFPTPVKTLIAQSLPWTVGLLLSTTLLSWVIGSILGGFAGYYPDKKWVKIVDLIAMVIRPMPYYILALSLLILFGFIFPIFPVRGGFSIGGKIRFDLYSIVTILKHAFLPALSLLLIGTFVWFQGMKLIVQTVKSEDYVRYAKYAGVPEKKIVYQYVIRNAMLPQITGLALSLGQIFSGALITEMTFSYPGMGTLLYNAVFTGDYNLLMGITSISIIVITTSVFLIDLLYPLLDPRVKYK
ncbi:MAG: ABC transporter permease [Fervidobacterium pennivorans]|uniref:ABC transporter permease n=2 Tax=Fervidobacterium TaxID=2422 RepID=A0A7C4WC70_FERPE|nr:MULTISPECIES: ABC transporter permease [Fervidobacterium]MDM7320556.1 ABC transporter permease [Fervidobacterium sp.]NPU88379.1 ABC transporter permease [Fervidobacterium sp.]QAV33814.1 ABC transporter permease [Fervidobacterium changbaicum]SDH67871.1 peptide/nickel transport system permease protein [Fervidobacterium changbaicum]